MEAEVADKDFVILINDHQGLIHKVCTMYCRNEEYRKDLFQEIVLQLWRSFHSYKGESKITTWMYRIALNTAITNFRKESRAPASSSIDDLKIDITDVNEGVVKAEQLNQLELAITQLSDIDRAIVMLYFEEVSYEEIGETLGITQNNVRVKMNRIRERLKKLLTGS